MRIIDEQLNAKDNRLKLKFGDLLYADIFRCKGNYYMKLNKNSPSATAVRLITGYLEHIKDNEIVELGLGEWRGNFVSYKEQIEQGKR